jgi:hypothetical protein
MEAGAGEVRFVPDGDDLFIIYDGQRIAKCGKPGTPLAGIWIALVPGWTITSDEQGGLAVAFDPRARH